MSGFRDLALTLVVLGALPVAALHPWIGVLLWSWLGYMNPHQLTWGFARTMPFAQLLAIATLVGFVLARDKKPFIWCRETIVLLALWGWTAVTTFTAIYPDEARGYWIDFSKILLMSLLTIPFFQDRRRLRLLLIVIAVSIGFYGFKGGIWVLMTGGHHMVLGAPGHTFISTNNAVGLALNMCLPIMLGLAREEPRRWARYGFYAAFFLSMLAIPFTYSRGAVLGLACVLAALFVRVRVSHIVLLATVAVVGVMTFVMVAPDKLIDRINTIREWETQGSALSRLTAWGVGLGLANDRPLVGGGFWVFNHQETFDRYAPAFGGFLDAHSIYFNLLGEHGYPGLALFLLLMFFTMRTLWSLRALGRRSPEVAWAGHWAHMLQAAIVAYLVTGAFMSMAYFDLAYHFLVIAVLVRHIAKQELEAVTREAISGEAPLPARVRPQPGVARSGGR
jgi:probable O-glycosylation ligase (exosortase A-associated)